MKNKTLIKLIMRLVNKSGLTEDQKKIIISVIKDNNVKAYDGNKILKVFIKKDKI